MLPDERETGHKKPLGEDQKIQKRDDSQQEQHRKRPTHDHEPKEDKGKAPKHKDREEK
jgi:hypothetical protein